ncbi:hypothetical protein SeMB42_g02627 [Synchytrium endobioticum]|uniref:Uncharacterized protein n=1 Tax=Synchytrium endobioticum TaxID=286115 RepID=A0A507DCZ3_9FUNG|nr:hypothetical protein SeMB42_g02627 [Synchytrium endobioticum]
MVLLVKLRVVAFLIFCTLAQSAPTDLENAIEAAVIILKNRRTDTTVRGIPTLKLFPNELVSHYNPDKLLLSMIATIAAEVFPEPEIYPIDRLLSPHDPETMDRGQIRLARAYFVCVFEKLKFIFRGINHLYHAGYKKQLESARTLAWDYLLILRNRGKPYSRYRDKNIGFPLPDDKALSRDEPSSDFVDCGIENLKLLTKMVITELKAWKEKERKDRCKINRLDMANWLHSQLEGGNAHGSDNSVPPMMEFTNDVDTSTPNPDNSMEYFDFFRKEIDHDGHHDQPTSEFIDFLGEAEKQDFASLDLSLGMHDPERLKGAILHIREPSPLALLSSHWHHSESSSHSYDKGKMPMHDDGATDIYPTPRSKRFG